MNIFENIKIHLGYRHWYQIRFVCKTKGLIKVFDFEESIGIAEQNIIFQHRKIKKSFPPLHKRVAKVDHIKKLLCSGHLTVEVVCYLGHFKK